MRSFTPGRLERYMAPPQIQRNLRRLGEHRGREGLYAAQLPEQLKALRRSVSIESTESSNRIEGIEASPQRLLALFTGESEPVTRPEQEIAGYRDTLRLIHENHAEMRAAPGLVLQLHQTLLQHTDSRGGRWKDSPNDITETRADGTRHLRFKPVAPHLTPEAMGQLHSRFSALWQEGEVEQMILIPAYVLDFLCIHPFRDGNGRLSRLLTLLLLYQAGSGLGAYVSLEKIIEESKDRYYEVLAASSKGWHEGRHDLGPWLDYFHWTLLTAYQRFEAAVEKKASARGAKTSVVLAAIEAMPRRFTLQQLRLRCTAVGPDMIRKVLRDQKKAGRLNSEGEGRAAAWIKVMSHERGQ